MSLLDFIISSISPSAGVRRMQNKMALDILAEAKKKRKFEGAGRGRRLGNWGANNGSQNAEIGMALNDLRNRSRELCFNNGYASRVPGKWANNVVGTGILLSINQAGKNKRSIAKLKQVWKDWSEKTECDFNDQQNLYGIQHLVIKSLVKNGECIIKRVRTKHESGKVPLKLQILDPDFLDSGNSKNQLENGGYIINGIEFNSDGKRVAYWIFDRHPKDFIAKSKRILAEDICHIYELDDAGQVRGLPFFTSVILRMKDFDEYEDAQLMKQKISACFAVFRTKTDIPVGQNPSQEYQPLDRVEPGMIEELPPGETVTTANPPSTEGFAEYSKQSLIGQAAGTGLTYEMFTGDFSNVNFSSGRMGWIEFNRYVEHLQWNVMVPMFLDKIFEWFYTAADISGFTPPSRTDFNTVWTPPRREMIDPAKEVTAMVKAIRSGLISWKDAVSQLGYNPEDMIEAMKASKELFDEAGVLPECDPRYDPERINKEQGNTVQVEK